ncbi:MAG: PEP-CTERM sorting domain-containing protein [Coleofasciculus sp. B1-GNL1-01]|uniref:PEP-CTERM sorting domain-containing protein n=1 Tax=Coleofasciculus sp. B1-GNL1-01 TaxID=3068484 RepID=UPI0032F95879
MTTFTSRLLGSGLLATSIALASSLVAANAAQALTINFDSTSTSTNNLATGASAQVDFDFVDVEGGGVQLDLTLLNTTGQLDDSFGLGATDSEFVAFGFDVSDSISSYTYNSLSSPFIRLFGNDSLTSDTVEDAAVISGAGGQNVFDIGIRVAGSGTFSGGNPNGGLNPGQSAQVRFILDTSDNAQAVEQAFANLFNGEEFRAVARFQDVNAGGGSDKLLVNRIPNADPDDNGDVSVPEPGTLAGLALIGGSLAAARRRKSC